MIFFLFSNSEIGFLYDGWAAITFDLIHLCVHPKFKISHHKYVGHITKDNFLYKIGGVPR